MKAAQLHEAGGPEQLYIGEVPIPEPGENQVLIKVYATAINRADTLQVLFSTTKCYKICFRSFQFFSVRHF